MEHILTSSGVKVVVRPDLGARVDQITDLDTGKDWLWHPERYKGETRELSVGASFDENWSGGWDEVFPNDAGGAFRGRNLADHGELWSRNWRVTESSASEVRLACDCSTLPAACEKRIAVTAEGLIVGYRLQNLSGEALPFLLKLHPALAVEPGDEILLPPCTVEPVDAGFSTIIGRSEKTRFPTACGADGKKVRLDIVPAREAGTREFFYSTGLEGPWCGLKNSRTGRTLKFSFDSSRLPYVWVFASYGGWQDHYVLILEPCTNVPYDLETALFNGTCAILQPHEMRDIEVRVTLSGEALSP